MNEERKLYFSGSAIDLDNVKFTRLSKPEVQPADVKIITEDDYEIHNVTLSQFSITCNRRIELDPKVYFEVFVSFEVTIFFAKETMKEFDGKLEELRRVIDSKIDKILLLTGVYARASSLISSITMQYNGNPVITAPIFSKK